MIAGKVMVAMSGGVDSSVAAWLLAERGCTCLGVTLKLFANQDIGISREKTCCSLRDAEDARRVAQQVGIPFYVLNFTNIFKEQVMDRFVDAYSQAITPNPCIDCNRYIKFDRLLQRALVLGHDYLATGHYARIEFDARKGRYLLKKGLDQAKDQSYVLYSLTQAQLAKIIFPLGEMTKRQIRAIALQQNFANAAKHDSQDICFVPDGDYARFIEDYRRQASAKGYFTDRQGHILGEHRGIIHYTIGQRRGLNLALGKPVYVCAINARENTVVVDDASALYSQTVIAKDINLIAWEKIDRPLTVKARLRYRHREQPAQVWQLDENSLRIEFEQPQRAVTKGQAVVLYDDDIVIGGGTIA
ncbi:MAG: tRNA 2-thiouridine(34) synthase MnmA [Desulfarculales bacterium]|jgi:tRNA-specific 2-thiouridylase|nr:tRNA 2-thiouridine(34) synthase MnmA [Desulfarculales bacterium]